MIYLFTILLYLTPLFKEHQDKGKIETTSWSARIYLVAMTPTLAANIYVAWLDDEEKDFQYARLAADQARRDLHEALESKQWNRLTSTADTIRHSLKSIVQHGGAGAAFVPEHDLAIAYERMAYGDSDAGCVYWSNKRLRVSNIRIHEGSDLQAAPKVLNGGRIRCTDVDDRDAWQRAKLVYSTLGEHLRELDHDEDVNQHLQYVAAARSVGYFIICDALRMQNGEQLESAREFFQLAALYSEARHGSLSKRNEDAVAKLAFLESAIQTDNLDKELWHQECSGPAKNAPMAPEYAYSISPIPDSVRSEMLGNSWHQDFGRAPFDSLRLVNVMHWNMEGQASQGTIVVDAQVAEDVAQAFRELFYAYFPVADMQPVDLYGGDDSASMLANNTSAFNCRRVSGAAELSHHAYGTAIDINPVFNPHISPSGWVSPPSGSAFKNRGITRPGMVVVDGPVVRAFGNIGWYWGGDWEKAKDYQHFSLTGR